MEEELFINELEDDENEQSELTFDSFKNTSTLSLDLNIDTIGLYYNRGKFVFDPDFQRRLVWDDKRKSQFIESLLLNIPIPSILLADDKNRNQYIIIDGKQRLSTNLQVKKFLNRLITIEVTKYPKKTPITLQLCKIPIQVALYS